MIALALAMLVVAAHADGPTEREIPSEIESVVLYQGRAAVTRTASANLEAGLWKLRLEGLPSTMDPDSLEAKASAGTILSVDFSTRAAPDASASPEAAELDRQIREAESGVGIDEGVLAGLAADARFIDSISVRAAADASGEAGSAKLDLAAVEGQLKWIGAQRAKIQDTTRSATTALATHRAELAALVSRRAALGGTSGSVQSADVVLALSEPASLSLRLSYLVAGAYWEPVYAIRANPEADTVAVEIDALVVQASGEPWEGVRLSLSTARPTHSASPPTVAPWFIDVIVERPPQSPAVRSPTGMSSGFADASADSSYRAHLGERTTGAPGAHSPAPMEPASVESSGPTVTYTIALPFDAPSDAQTRRRARIASFDAPAAFVYQAQPCVADGAYLRGRLTNTSAFHMLPGRALIFVHTDFVGAMRFGGGAPKQEFDVYFGVDPAVSVTRTLISREDRASGLFGGGLDTVSTHRTLITNATGRSIGVELLDFRPVSRSSKVEVALSTSSVPLSTDLRYLDVQQPQGILRWDLTVPPTPSGSDGVAVTWTTVVSRSKDIEVTPLPTE